MVKQIMLYSTPKNVLQMKINEALGSNEEEMISDLIKLCLMKPASKNQDYLVYTEIYNLLGLEKFTDLISLLDGKTVKFPTKEEFKDTVLTVLCYYYRNVLNLEWNDIKEKLGLPDINTIRQGIRSSQYEAFLKELINKRIKE